MKKIIADILIFIFIFIIIVNLYIMLDLSIFGIRFYKIEKVDMEPYLRINDHVMVKKLVEYKLNDVIAYTTDKNEFVISRIIHIGTEGYTTKFDTINTFEKPIKKENIIGKVIIRFRLLGNLLNIFDNIVMLIMLFIIVIVIGTLTPKETIDPAYKRKGKSTGLIEKIKKEITKLLIKIRLRS